MRSSEQLTRMLRLVPYLAAHQGITTAEAAKAFGVTVQQIIRDIEVLQFCGLPGGYYDDLFDVNIDVVRDEGIIFFNNAEVLERPLRLRPVEAASLLAALKLVSDIAGDSEAATSAYNKLAAAVGAAETVSIAVTSSGSTEHIAQLKETISQRQAVRLRYWTAGRDGISTAEVEPARLRFQDGFNYLDAWSRPRAAWRSFRLDRIEGIEILDSRCEDHGNPPEGWFGDVTQSFTVTVTPEARWIAEAYPTSSVEDHGDKLVVRFPVTSVDWAVSLLLRLGDRVLAVDDPQLVSAARQRAVEALANYPETSEVGLQA